MACGEAARVIQRCGVGRVAVQGTQQYEARPKMKLPPSLSHRLVQVRGLTPKIEDHLGWLPGLTTPKV